MASRELIKYDNSPALKLLKLLTPLFLTVYLIWTLLPLFIMVMASMKDLLDAFDTPKTGDWAGVAMFFDFTPTFKHYYVLFAENNFGIYLMNSLIASLGSAVVAVTLGSMAAYSLARMEFRGKKDLLF